MGVKKFSNTVILLGSAAFFSQKLASNLNEVDPFFKKYPFKFKPISDWLHKTLGTPLKRETYDFYRKLAVEMGLKNIPPYVATATDEPLILDRPVDTDKPVEDVLQHPATEVANDANIIYTPEGSQVDTSTEFPGEKIDSWENYLLYKRQSEILADNMFAANMEAKPAGYAAHHIVSWNSKLCPICQDLRDLLSANNIGINDAANGVYLPHYKYTKNDVEAYHPHIHTKTYYDTLYDRIERHNGNQASMKAELIKIGNELKLNKFTF